MTVRAINHHDNVLLPDSLEKLINIADDLALDIFNAYLTLDSAFHDEDNKVRIEYLNLIPVIKPNPRGAGREKRYALLDEFEPLEHIYKERHKIERDFAWKSKYRKLVIRYEKLQCTFMGFRLLAYTMVNFRELFGRNVKNPI